MREIIQIMAISAAFGLLLLFAGPASAAGHTNLPQGCTEDIGKRMSANLDHLESLGYDISNINAVITNSDFQAAHILMQKFMQEQRGELPTPHSGERPEFCGHADRSSKTV